MAEENWAALEDAPLPAWLAPVEHDPDYGWAITAWRRAERQPEAWFDAAKADAIVELWPQVFKLTVDRFAGIPFRLNGWQEIIVRLLVGWKITVEVIDPLTGLDSRLWVRLFRRLMLWVPRKNGKSEFLAALALLFWALEEVVGNEGYVFGRDEKQGRIILNKMKAMIAYAPQLAVETQVFAKSIYLKPCAARFELLSGAEEGKHGKNPNVIAGDEMHEWRSREIENTLRQGTGGRLQPIELYASTSGLKTNRTGMELWDESRSILDGGIDDATTLVVIFAADADADWTDEAVWRRANPSLGLSPTLQFLRREAAIAKDNPRAEAHFRCYHLNQWIDSAVRWLNMKRWDACAHGDWRTVHEECIGRRAIATFDLSSTRDVTAKILLFEPEGEDRRWRIGCRFWVPEETLAERVKNDRVPYDKWLAAGAIETTPGDYVDQSYVQAALEEDFARYEIGQLGFDPWNVGKLLVDLQKSGVDPEIMVAVRQGIASLGDASKEFERLVYAGLLDHGGHPVLRWMAANTVVRFDENLNFMPAKKRSAEKIDGIVAAVTGLAVVLGAEAEDGPSVYEGRGILEVEV